MTTPCENLLGRLEAVKKSGVGKWKARCPAHSDRTPSLSVREEADGRILLHCFGGCSVEAVLAAAGLSFEDLYPPRPPSDHRYAPLRRPWLPSDAYETARHEILIVVLIGCDLHAQKVIAESDYERLFLAVQRLNAIGEAAYGSR